MVLAEAMVKQLVAHIRIAAGDKGANKAAAAVQLYERDKNKAKAIRTEREVPAEQSQRLAAALGGGQPLEGLTEELIQAAYG